MFCIFVAIKFYLLSNFPLRPGGFSFGSAKHYFGKFYFFYLFIYFGGGGKNSLA